MSGRNSRQSVGSLAISSRARSGSLERPCMTCTKPACEGSPGVSTSTEVLLWNTGSPVNSAAVRSHHAVCSGRSPFCRAASADSKRARAISVPSPVTPDVLPSHPTAPGATSSTHLSSCARTCAASDTWPWITCTNMLTSLLPIPRAGADRSLRRYSRPRAPGNLRQPRLSVRVERRFPATQYARGHLQASARICRVQGDGASARWRILAPALVQSCCRGTDRRRPDSNLCSIVPSVPEPDIDRVTAARIAAVTRRHARGRALTGVEETAALTELAEVAAGRVDLLAQ